MKDDQNNRREFGRKMFQQFLDVLQTTAPRASDCNYEIVWPDADEPRCRDGLAPLALPPSFDTAHHIEGIGHSHGGSPLLRREHYRSLSRRLAEPDADGDRKIRAAARNSQLFVDDQGARTLRAFRDKVADGVIAKGRLSIGGERSAWKRNKKFAPMAPENSGARSVSQPPGPGEMPLLCCAWFLRLAGQISHR
jgi:hypothetical protein